MTASRPLDDRSAPAKSLPVQWSGDEVRIILFGAQSCGASNDATFLAAFKELRGSLKRLSTLHPSIRIKLVGIAIDVSLERGLDFLRRTGPFDEISVGGNWLNDAAVELFWRDRPGPAALPQVVVVRRPVKVTQRNYWVGGDSIVMRKTGIHDIIEWIGGGASLPGVGGNQR